MPPVDRDPAARSARHRSGAPPGRLGATYVATGGDGTPQRLLIHGGMSEASEWGLLAGPLLGAIAIVDRPGCGLSYRIDYLDPSLGPTVTETAAAAAPLR